MVNAGVRKRQEMVRQGHRPNPVRIDQRRSDDSGLTRTSLIHNCLCHGGLREIGYSSWPYSLSSRLVGASSKREPMSLQLPPSGTRSSSAADLSFKVIAPQPNVSSRCSLNAI